MFDIKCEKGADFIQSMDLLVAALRGTVFEGRQIKELWLFDSTRSVYFIDLSEAREFEELAVLSSLKQKTGLYPVMAKRDYIDHFFSNEPDVNATERNWVDKSAESEMFSEGMAYLASGGESSEFSPTRGSNWRHWLAEPADRRQGLLVKTASRFGNAPSFDQLEALCRDGKLQTDAEFERWMFKWEIEHFGEAALVPDSVRYLENFELSFGERPIAVLLPTLRPWKVLRFMGWYGLEAGAAEKEAALLVWERRYGAELVGSFCTSLDIAVNRRPQTVDEAFDLAIEHYHFASDTLTLPCISLRDHARSLLSVDRWFFHSKP